jgi:hypothetical protein
MPTYDVIYWRLIRGSEGFRSSPDCSAQWWQCALAVAETNVPPQWKHFPVEQDQNMLIQWSFLMAAVTKLTQAALL